MTFNTGNNVPSTDPRDLYDNAENLDKLVNGADPFYADRKGVLRQSWAGMENDFDTAQEGRETTFTASQEDKESRFQAFLVSAGYVSKGDYAASVVLAERNEYVAVDAATTGTSPGLYRPNAAATLPLTLTGTWATDSANLVLLGDDVLRQDLAGPGGAAQIGYKQRTVDARLGDIVSVRDFGATGDGVTDDSSAIQAALNTGKSIFVPPGVFYHASSLFFVSDNQFIVGGGWDSVLKSGPGSVYYNSDGLDNLGIGNIRIDGDGANGGVRPEAGTQGFIISKVLFTGGNQRVWLFACSHVTVSECTFKGCGYQIIQENGYTSNDVKVIGNSAIDCTGDFVLGNCEDGFQSKNWIIANNTVTNVGGSPNAPVATEDRFVGMTYVDGLIIMGNTVDGVAGDSAIHLESPGRTKIIGNVFRNCRGASAAARFVYILPITETSLWYAAAADVVISGNDFIVDTDFASPATAYINTASVLESGRLIISDNNFIYHGSAYPGDPASNEGTGIQIGSSLGYVDVRDNQFRSLATGLIVSSNSQGSPAIKRGLNATGNVFERCTTGIIASPTGHVNCVDSNRFVDCGESFALSNPPISIRNNQFISTTSNGWKDILLGTASGNTFQNSTTDCASSEIEQQVADGSSILLGRLGGQTAKGLITIYARRNSSSSVSSACYHWLYHPAAGLVTQEVAPRLSAGTSTASFSLAFDGGYLKVVVADTGGTGATYGLNFSATTI